MYTNIQREQFQNFVESLKLVRKANLEDATTGETIIDDIYADLLPNNGIINKINTSNTTVVSGRKGTGKSTIFQKSINDIIQKDDTLCIYIDVKSLVETTILPQNYQTENNVVSNNEVKKYLIYVEFLKIIISETKRKIDDKISSDNLFVKLFKNDSRKFDRVHDKLNEISENINNVFKNIDVTLFKYVKETHEKTDLSKSAVDVNISNKPSISGSIESSKNAVIKKEFQDTIARYLDIKSMLINNLMAIRDVLDLKYIYIYLDDFSEVEIEGQEFFINWFVAPLNNHSDNFIKFKIAVYPYRFYEGELDPAKYDQINLDFFDSFNSHGNNLSNSISHKENLAVDYTKRLLNNRFKYYFKETEWKIYFNCDEKELYQLLFHVSQNITRKIGFILSYCFESCLIYNKPITGDDIKNASVRYYEEITEKFFKTNLFIKRPFNDKISIENQHLLLQEIIKNSTVNSKRNKNNGSYFVIGDELNNLFENLNLNGYLSLYNRLKTKHLHDINVYLLDYGLCVHHNLTFSPPTQTIDQLIKSSSIDSIVISFFNNTQTIKCNEGHEFEYKEIEHFKRNSMKCITCLQNNKLSTCEIVPTDRKLLERLAKIENKRKDPINYSEYLVLDQLSGKDKALPIKYLSERIDLSIRTVESILIDLGKKKLVENDLQAEASVSTKKKFYLLTDKGVEFMSQYFKET